MEMVISFHASFIILSLIFTCSSSQEPNTDGFFISSFFQKMGKETPLQTNGFLSPLCSWPEVSCDAQMSSVVSLNVSGMNLSGPIPENTIGKLTKLQVLDLSNNALTSLSSDFWGLGSSLISLNLSRNRIDGFLSNNIGNFGELKSIDLSHNKFSGEIPVAIGSLYSLKVVDFSGNYFEGKIPDEIVGCKNLVSVDFSMNKLYGIIPTNFCSVFKNLQSLNLAENRFTGKLPNLSGLQNFKFLNVSNNFFQGSIIETFSQSIETIDLSKNQLQGHILHLTINLPSLHYLDLSENQLSGKFFSDLNKAQSLKHLNLAFNRFSHQKFPQIQNLSHLEYLNFSKTNLVGHIPADISSLSSLFILDLSKNHLSGHIPNLNSISLQTLDLSSNNLTGEIPLTIQQQLPNLPRFNFSYNNLTFCPEQLPPKTSTSSFIGSKSDCPIAANPDQVTPNTTKHKSMKLALAISLTIFFLLLASICLILGFKKRTKSWVVKQLSYKEDQRSASVSGPFSFQTDSTTWVADVKQANSVSVIIFDKPLLNFTFADLLHATSNFDRGTLLAEGRYGPVYRGFLPNGTQVAMKVLVHSTTLTDQELSRELERLGRIRHQNLVPLTGYCLARDQRIALYEYMENGNLENLLHDLPLDVQSTDDWSNDVGITNEGTGTWVFRHRVALGTARALAFLHHGCSPQLVHRDVKASSVYLDSKLEPRLSDFGLDKVVDDLDEDISKSMPGYVAPEFFEGGVSALSSKSDVYGFGVVLFELVTGKKPIGDRYPEEKGKSLVVWAREFVKKNRGCGIIDPKIRSSASEKEMEEVLRIAYLCTADLPSKRPTMQQVVGLLKDLEPVVAEL